jgi:hypothetical protein
MTNDHTLTPDYYEFSLGSQGDGDEPSHVGLHIVEGDTRTTVPLALRDAEVVGRMILAHVDYAAGRPPRNW